MTGVELKRARMRKGLLQKEIAEDAGIGPSEICRIENGERNKLLKRWTKILNAYGFAIAPIEPKTAPDEWNEYTEQTQ